MITILRSDGSKAKTSAGAVKTQIKGFRGWRCAVGSTLISINSRGEVWGSVCKAGGSLGNVFDRSWDLPKSLFICNRDSCHCSSDLKIPKGVDVDSIKSVLHSSTDIPTVETLNDVVAVSRYLGNSQRSFSVDWNIGNRCNFDCSYCSPRQHNNRSPHLSFEAFCSAWDDIRSKIPSPIILSFLGGEPTLNPRYLDMCEYAHDKTVSIVTTTNGTAHVDKLIRAIRYGGMTISIHLEFINIPKILDKIHSIAASIETHNFLNIAFMMPPGNADRFFSFRDALPTQSNVRIEAVPIFDNDSFNLLHYSDEETKIINSNY